MKSAFLFIKFSAKRKNLTFKNFLFYTNTIFIHSLKSLKSNFSFNIFILQQNAKTSIFLYNLYQKFFSVTLTASTLTVWQLRVKTRPLRLSQLQHPRPRLQMTFNQMFPHCWHPICRELEINNNSKQIKICIICMDVSL